MTPTEAPTADLIARLVEEAREAATTLVDGEWRLPCDMPDLLTRLADALSANESLRRGNALAKAEAERRGITVDPRLEGHRASPIGESAPIEVRLSEMVESKGKSWWVELRNPTSGHSVTPYRSYVKGRAEYEAETYRALLDGRDPDDIDPPEDHNCPIGESADAAEVVKRAESVDAGLENIANDYAIQLQARNSASKARDLIRDLIALVRGQKAASASTFLWPAGTKPELHELFNGSMQIVDVIEDAPLITITGHNGVDPKAFLAALTSTGTGVERTARIEAAARKVNAATFSHVDGRDLLAQLHPRHELDIKRRVDGKETWFEGDWLSDLYREMKQLRAALGEQ